jgi:arylsulfatase A-like enzyme
MLAAHAMPRLERRVTRWPQHRLSARSTSGIALLATLLGCGPDPSGHARGLTHDTSAPPPAAVTITPAAPRAGDTLRCTVDAPPTPLWAFSWERDGTAMLADSTEHPGDTVPPEEVGPSQQWTCHAHPPSGVELGAGSASVQTAPPPGGNVLLVLLDDVGIDKVAAYGEHPTPPPTPTLDALAAQGVRFTQAFSYPTCSAARAALLTGRYGRRNGIGDTVRIESTYELPLQELLLGEILLDSPLNYTSAAIGKWHLSGLETPSAQHHPNLQGFDWFSGTLGNITEATHQDGQAIGYDHWEHTLNGVQTFEDGYLTTRQIDDALARIQAMPEPWFVYLSLSAPHSPLHEPPAHLHTSEGPFDTTKVTYFDAMLEAADTELGRLLDSMDSATRDRTTVMVMGDNGTPSHSVLPPWDPERSKATMYDGGIRVPLIVHGPHVAARGSRCDALVHAVDLAPTVADIAGVPNPAKPMDGVSLLGCLSDPDGCTTRPVLYAERFMPNGPPPYREVDARAVRDDTHKLVRFRDGSEQLYALKPGALDEGHNLLADPEGLAENDAVALQHLQTELAWFEGNLRYEAPD